MKTMKRQNRLFALFLPLLLIFSLFSACAVNTKSIASSGILISPASQNQLVESSGVGSATSEVSSAASSIKTSSEIISESAQAPSETSEVSSEIAETPETVVEAGSYTSKDDVALYIHLFGHLPGNFITKVQASALGWTGGGLEAYAPGKCIGGDYFGNYEGLLPKKSGRTFAECDINTLGASSRGAKRIVFSNDGLVYYTPDHYESFTLLYGDPNV